MDRKILIFNDWYLPDTTSGGPVRSIANMVNHLEDGFQFYIIARDTSYQTKQPLTGITSNTWISFNSYTQVYYVSKKSLSVAGLKKIIRSINYDVAFINGIYSWYFSILPIFFLKKNKKPIVISARGMLNTQAFSVKKKKKKSFLRIANLISLYKGVHFHATNKDETINIKKYIKPTPVVLEAPNLPRKMKSYKPKGLQGNLRKYICVARIAPEKGTLTLIKSLQKIDSPLKLDLYGTIYNGSYWQLCKQEINKLPKNVSVNYKGVLESEKVPSTIASYDFLALFSDGENFGHAIFEAFSVGTPVLISNNTPWKNLAQQKIGWDVNLKNLNEIEKAFSEANSINNIEYTKWSQSTIIFAKNYTENPKWLAQNKALFIQDTHA